MKVNTYQITEVRELSANALTIVIDHINELKQLTCARKKLVEVLLTVQIKSDENGNVLVSETI